MTKKKISTITLLKAAERKAIKKAIEARDQRQFSEKAKWEERAHYIKRQLIYFNNVSKRGSTVPPVVFVSYSKQTATTYFQYIKKLLEDQNFEVTTGFKKAQEDDGNVLKRVMTQLNNATLFLGILTKEYKIITNEGPKWGPSVWTVEEKGMALALKRPLTLLIEKGVHEDFWKKTSPHKIYISFTQDNFFERAAEVVETVVDRYNEKLRESLNT